MNVTEFLEARITEDEVKATLRAVHADDCGWIPNEAGYSYPCDCGIPERMAAECKAKRVMLDGWKGMVNEHRRAFKVDPPLSPVVAAFAAIYRDHPDYQREWAL